MRSIMFVLRCLMKLEFTNEEIRAVCKDLGIPKDAFEDKERNKECLLKMEVEYVS